MTEAERDLVLFHLVFALAAAALLVGTGAAGWRLVAVVALYAVGTVAVGLWRRRRWWLRLWWFASVASLWLVFPLWFLAALGVLVFPRDGVPDVGPVTASMVGVWAPPLVAVIATAAAVEERRGRAAAAATAGVVGAVLVVGAQALFAAVGLWRSLNVATLGSVAVYLVPANVLLAVAAYDLHQQSRHRPPVADVAAGLLLMLLYLGTAAFGYLLVEWIPR